MLLHISATFVGSVWPKIRTFFGAADNAILIFAGTFRNKLDVVQDTKGLCVRLGIRYSLWRSIGLTQLRAIFVILII